jgi:uncharacterized repeat protein (TIGR01451 family)
MSARNKVFHWLALGAVVVGGAVLVTTMARGSAVPPPAGSDVSTVDSADGVERAASTEDGAGISIEHKARNAVVRPGDQVTFSITVRNTGSKALSGVRVFDALFPDCSQHYDGDLGVDGQWTFGCAGTAPLDDVKPSARVSGRTSDGGRVAASDEAKVDVIHPGITLQQGSPATMARAAAPFTVTVSVANTGDSPLRDVFVAYPDAPGCQRQLGELAPRERQTYTCTIMAGSDDFTGTARANGTDGTSRPVTSAADLAVDVIHPSLEVIQKGPAKAVPAGKPARFSTLVRNDGDVPLIGVTATAPGCSMPLGRLDPGITALPVTCDAVVGDEDLAHPVTVTAADPAGGEVTGRATGTARLAKPALVLTTVPGSQTTTPGAGVTFTLSAANAGNVDLAPVHVGDPGLEDCDRTFDRLAPGAREEWTCTGTVPQSGVLISTVSGTGTPDTEPAADAVSGTATATVGGAALPGDPAGRPGPPGEVLTGTGQPGLAAPPEIGAPAEVRGGDTPHTVSPPIDEAARKSLAGTGVGARLPGMLGVAMVLFGAALVMAGRFVLRRR